MDFVNKAKLRLTAKKYRVANFVGYYCYFRGNYLIKTIINID